MVKHLERIIIGGEALPEVQREHLARYKYATTMVKGLDVLDLACGTGYGSMLLASAGAKSVIGIDRSDDAITYASTNYVAKNLKYRRGDAQRVELSDGCMDAVVSFETIEHLPDDVGYLKEVRRVLRPGGLYVVSTPDRRLSGAKARFGKGSPFHVREYSRDEFIRLLETNGFATEEVLGQRFVSWVFALLGVKLMIAVVRRLHAIPGISEGLPLGSGPTVEAPLGRRIARFWVVRCRKL